MHIHTAPSEAMFELGFHDPRICLKYHREQSFPDDSYLKKETLMFCVNKIPDQSMFLNGFRQGDFKIFMCAFENCHY